MVERLICLPVCTVLSGRCKATRGKPAYLFRQWIAGIPKPIILEKIMKKNAFAIAAATFALTMAGSASAQSTVTMYGLIDVGVEYLNHANANGDSLIREIGANMAGSRWGVRGSEDLGGGLKATMTLEGGFRPDTGVIEQGGRLFGRLATVGLQGDFGALTVGRQAIVLNDVMFSFDPMAFALYSVATLDGKFFGRADNSIKYIAPTVGGLTGSAYYSFGLDTAFAPTQGEVPGNGKVGRAWGVAARYAGGPFGVGLVVDRVNSGVAAKANAGDMDQRVALAANYKFGEATVFGGYRRLKSDVAGTNGVRSDYYWSGLTYNATPALKLTGAIYHNNIKNTEADPSLFVLNADYSLSKRTDLYASLGYAKNRKDGLAGTSVGVTAGGEAVSSGAPGVGQTGVVMGIRHRF